MRAALSIPHRHRNVSRNAARAWSRAARCCLVLLACLAQLLVPAQPRHAPHIASHSIVFITAATSSGLSLTSSARNNQASAARLIARWLPRWQRPRHHANTTIARVARRCMPMQLVGILRSFCRGNDAGGLCAAVCPKPSRRPRALAHLPGLRILPGSRARHQS